MTAVPGKRYRMKYNQLPQHFLMIEQGQEKVKAEMAPRVNKYCPGSD